MGDSRAVLCRGGKAVDPCLFHVLMVQTSLSTLSTELINAFVISSLDHILSCDKLFRNLE